MSFFISIPLVIIGILLIFCVLVARYSPQETPTCPTRYLLECRGSFNVFLMRSSMLKRISSLIPFFIINLIALSESGVKSLIDGAIAVISTDPNVLEVTALGDGKFHVLVKGPGLATLIVTADVDLSDDVHEITQSFPFEIYDATLEATHFDLAIEVPKPVELLADQGPTKDAVENTAAETAETEEVTEKTAEETAIDTASTTVEDSTKTN